MTQEKDTPVITIHLSSGAQIDVVGEKDMVEDDVDAEEAASALIDLISTLDKPGFIRLGNVVVHTQAVSAFVVDFR